MIAATGMKAPVIHNPRKVSLNMFKFILVAFMAVFSIQAFALEQPKLHTCNKNELEVYREMAIGATVGGAAGGGIVSIIIGGSTIAASIAGAAGAIVVYEINMRQVCNNTYSHVAEKAIKKQYEEMTKKDKKA